MERLCGMLLPLVNSRLNPYINLCNNVTLLERFNHLHFIPFFNDKLNNQQVQHWKENMVYSNEDYEEEFYWPTQKYTISQNELQKLKIYFNSLNLNNTNIMVKFNLLKILKYYLFLFINFILVFLDI